MHSFQVFLALMTVSILLVNIALKLRIPYPIALVVGGAAIGFIPGIEPVTFDPNLILVMVLPPILYYATFGLAHREFMRNFKEIASLAIGLVIATTLVVGIVFKWLFPQLPWELAFAFGAIVSPPDATAASTILRRFSIRSRLLTVLEGESLVNDASALVLYRIALVAMLSGSFSMAEGSVEFVRVVTGGILLGAVTGLVFQRFSQMFLQPIVGVLFSFTIPYMTFITADLVGVSGVLAVVVNGLIGARVLSRHQSALRRVVGFAVWDVFFILMNCFVFILLGYQLRAIVERLSTSELLLYTGYGLLFTLVMIVVRLVWVYAKQGIAYWRVPENSGHATECRQISREGAILAWSGMRGIVSLTAALALPLTVASGAALAGRDIVIFLVFVVILVTLLLPGLTLPFLIRRLGIHHCHDPDNAPHERKKMVKVAEKEIKRLSGAGHIDDEEREFLHNYVVVRHRVGTMSSLFDAEIPKLEVARRRILKAQREYLLKSWDRGEIDDHLLNMLERELDVEESHLARAEIH